jgi:hypothetical protein
MTGLAKRGIDEDKTKIGDEISFSHLLQACPAGRDPRRHQGSRAENGWAICMAIVNVAGVPVYINGCHEYGAAYPLY